MLTPAVTHTYHGLMFPIHITFGNGKCITVPRYRITTYIVQRYVQQLTNERCAASPVNPREALYELLCSSHPLDDALLLSGRWIFVCDLDTVHELHLLYRLTKHARERLITRTHVQRHSDAIQLHLARVTAYGTSVSQNDRRRMGVRDNLHAIRYDHCIYLINEDNAVITVLAA